MFKIFAKKKVEKKECEHDFEKYMATSVAGKDGEKYPRVIWKCRKCGSKETRHRQGMEPPKGGWSKCGRYFKWDV